jgi:molybdopterin-guanine dinucleotide biosynthesis protein B
LIERIVPELKKRGYRVGTIKHDAHRFEIDYEGKDSYRHFHSGADVVAIASPEKFALIKRLKKSLLPERIVHMYFTNVDIVITEGYKSQNMPKIEVVKDKKPMCRKKDNLIGLVSNKKLNIMLPQFKFSQINKICDFIESLVKCYHR